MHGIATYCELVDQLFSNWQIYVSREKVKAKATFTKCEWRRSIFRCYSIRSHLKQPNAVQVKIKTVQQWNQMLSKKKKKKKKGKKKEGKNSDQVKGWDGGT